MWTKSNVKAMKLINGMNPEQRGPYQVQTLGSKAIRQSLLHNEADEFGV